MIYIHGGAFHGGSGNEDKQNPEFLLGEDVIVVQINYRLSFLGFFSTADRSAPGNYGLKDSLEALRWVQSNIEAFGGDKDKVTVFGESAGGMIINYLKLSPLSKGLFHRAITESGSIMGSALSFQSYPRTYAFQIAKEMNITFENSEDLVRQLMEIEDARIFVKYSPEWIRDFQIPMGKTGLVFAPSVEPEDSDEPRVLPDTPLNLYLKGDFLDIPHIIMLMSEEHLMSARQLEEFPELFEHIEQNQEVLLPLTWNIRPNTLEADEYLRTINALYFNNEPIKNIYDYLHFASDSLWNFGSYKAARLQVTRQKSPVYFAVFSFSGDLSYFKISGGLKDFIGAGHADDLPYIFTTEYFPKVTEDNPSYKVRARTVKIWTNFAKYGDPTPVLDELVNVKWEPMRDGFFSFMNMSTEMHLERDPFGDRMKVWYEMDRRFN
ncbi:juvenile hormone esterase-like [Culicoides brevitarsis]|uniref:juvenile hormone esterase-like n=1 Tax=Culicoides brevitarsis TaxID=469753 RepID=UPI00307C1EBB